ILDEIERFVAESATLETHDRVLATVMNIRMVDPEAEARRGRRDVTALLDRARSFVRRQFRIYRGREVAYRNGGVLATFDGPARAIRCAAAIANAAGSLGIEFKSGIHTGECDVVGGEYSGFAVELAEKIGDAAPSGSIFASRTVKDLV